MKYKTFFLTLSVLLGLTLAGCSNTLDGAGRDIEHVGEKIQKTF